MAKPSTFKNMVLTLFLVTLTASAAVGFVYELTKGPIKETARKKQLQAIRDVLPDFNNDPLADQTTIKSAAGPVVIFPARQNDAFVGAAVKTFSDEGFGGRITLMVGFRPDGTIHNIEVLQHSETPGLGDKIQKTKSSFSDQFIGMNPDSTNMAVRKDGGDVDGITAATISSRAYIDAVAQGYAAYQDFRQQNQLQQEL